MLESVGIYITYQELSIYLEMALVDGRVAVAPAAFHHDALFHHHRHTAFHVALEVTRLPLPYLQTCAAFAVYLTILRGLTKTDTGMNVCLQKRPDRLFPFFLPH